MNKLIIYAPLIIILLSLALLKCVKADGIDDYINEDILIDDYEGLEKVIEEGQSNEISCIFSDNVCMRLG